MADKGSLPLHNWQDVSAATSLSQSEAFHFSTDSWYVLLHPYLTGRADRGFFPLLDGQLVSATTSLPHGEG